MSETIRPNMVNFDRQKWQERLKEYWTKVTPIIFVTQLNEHQNNEKF